MPSIILDIWIRKLTKRGRRRKIGLLLKAMKALIDLLLGVAEVGEEPSEGMESGTTCTTTMTTPTSTPRSSSRRGCILSSSSITTFIITSTCSPTATSLSSLALALPKMRPQVPDSPIRMISVISKGEGSHLLNDIHNVGSIGQRLVRI
jgi:hypothetical protein